MTSTIDPPIAEDAAAEPLPKAAADTDAAPAGAAVPEAPPASAPTRRPRRWPTVLLAGLAVAGFAGTGYFGRAWLAQRASGSQEAQVRSTATGFVTALTNFDPGTVVGDFSRIQSYATGSFATQARQFFGSTIGQQLQAAGAASRGQVADLFVESLSASQATVFAVVDQTYLNDKMSSAAADTLRLELVLSEQGSAWKVSTVTVLQSPAGFPTTSAPAKGKK